jgi:AraC family transcriptional regulator
MPVTLTDIERKKRIDHVVDYIFSNFDGQISLQTLAGVANYSPFHLQKVFKQIIGDSPKQYILKLRLETAFHLLVIHPQKSIREIAIDSGFSSPAVFSRAIKSYFGHSPEQIRHLPHREKMRLLHSAAPKSVPAQTPIVAPPSSSTAHCPAPTTGSAPSAEKTTIHTLKKASVKGIYLVVPFDEPEVIQGAFNQLSRIARAHDWVVPGSGMYGILGPHQRNTYKAFLPVHQTVPGTDRFPLVEIEGGQFATFKVRGDLRQTNKAAHYFYHRWLPDSGFKIAGVTGFETFSGNPALIPYYQLEREIHIPIEPAL